MDTINKEETAILNLMAKGTPRALQMPNSGGDTPLHFLVASKAYTSAKAAAEQAVSLMLGGCIEATIIQDSSLALTPLHTELTSEF